MKFNVRFTFILLFLIADFIFDIYPFYKRYSLKNHESVNLDAPKNIASDVINHNESIKNLIKFIAVNHLQLIKFEEINAEKHWHFTLTGSINNSFNFLNKFYLNFPELLFEELFITQDNSLKLEFTLRGFHSKLSKVSAQLKNGLLQTGCFCESTNPSKIVGILQMGSVKTVIIQSAKNFSLQITR